MHIENLVSNLARQIAQVGHSLRIESFDNVHKVKDYAKEIYYVAGQLAEMGQNESVSGLLKCAQAMIDAYNTMNSVALADVLEYELLHELEKLLRAVK
ncbi:MAG: hypothetical protein FWB91_02760 [Defluviitaleaceae bacterium]|nr:hypothetical protein [Defluviitaleaceae bacterium]